MDRTPVTYQEQAKAFFEEFSREYATCDNIIYEICNEPNSGVDWQTIKNYAQNVIPVIQNNDADAVIIVGTPDWSQGIDQAARDPLNYSNVMYALHFYAATHTEWLRDRLRQVKDSIPVFVSEFGICDASGNGAIDYEESQKWITLLDESNISYCMWNISNKAETSSIFNSWVSKTNGFTQDDLSESGKWLYSLLNTNTTPYELEGYSLSLSKEIGINFYFSMNDSFKNEQPTLLINNTKKIEYSQTKVIQNCVVYTYQIPFKEMTSVVKGQFMINDEIVGDSFTYTTVQYADYIQSHYDASSKESQIVRTMLTCGYYTQKYFQYHVEDLVSIEGSIVDVQSCDFTPYKQREVSSKSIQFIGARLVMSSIPGLKLYFIGDGDFYVDGKKQETIEENGYRVIYIQNVKDLSHMYSIQNQDYSLEYGIFSYAAQVKETDLLNVVRSLYLYQNL